MMMNYKTQKLINKTPKGIIMVQKKFFIVPDWYKRTRHFPQNMETPAFLRTIQR